MWLLKKHIILETTIIFFNEIMFLLRLVSCECKGLTKHVS